MYVYIYIHMQPWCLATISDEGQWKFLGNWAYAGVSGDSGSDWIGASRRACNARIVVTPNPKIWSHRS